MEITSTTFSKIDPKNLPQEALNYFLFLSVCENNLKAAKYFLNLGADITYVINDDSPVYDHFSYKQHEMLCFLFENDTDKKLHTKDILFRLIKANCVKTVDFLLNRMKKLGIDYKQYFDEAIRIATTHKDNKMVKLLFKYGTTITPATLDAYIFAIDDEDFNGISPSDKYHLDSIINNPKVLQYAAKFGKIHLVKFLIENGADCTAYNSCVLRIIVKNSRQETPEVLDLLQFLVSKGADCTACDNEAIKIVAKTDHVKTANFLIQHGADISVNEHEPLRIAIRHKQFEMVKFLVEHDADCTACNNEALHTVAERDYTHIMEYLLKTCNLPVEILNSILISTVSPYERPEIAELLFKFGADPNTNNQACLKEVISKTYPDMLELFFKYGATCTEELFNYAISKPHTDYEIVEQLVEHGAIFTNETIATASEHYNYSILEDIYDLFFTKLIEENN